MSGRLNYNTIGGQFAFTFIWSLVRNQSFMTSTRTNIYPGLHP